MPTSDDRDRRQNEPFPALVVRRPFGEPVCAELFEYEQGTSELLPRRDGLRTFPNGAGADDLSERMIEHLTAHEKCCDSLIAHPMLTEREGRSEEEHQEMHDPTLLDEVVSGGTRVVPFTLQHDVVLKLVDTLVPVFSRCKPPCPPYSERGVTLASFDRLRALDLDVECVCSLLLVAGAFRSHSCDA